jgi:hypothetical protein
MWGRWELMEVTKVHEVLSYVEKRSGQPFWNELQANKRWQVGSIRVDDVSHGAVDSNQSNMKTRCVRKSSSILYILYPLAGTLKTFEENPTDSTPCIVVGSRYP